MILIKSPTELTTSATDLFLAIECVFIIICLWRALAVDRWRTSLWCWVFGLLAFSFFMGSVAHGLDKQASMREALWMLLFLCLGVAVALLVAGALFDWRGRDMAKRLVWLIAAASIIFFVLSRFFDGALIIFVIYEALAIICTLAIYSFLAVTHRLKGSGLISLAILLSIVAAGVQASHVSMKVLFPFDHNGIFHLIEMVTLATLGWGLRIGMKP
ncbi:MAG: hypothetical protein ABSE95_17490 [Thermodesulfobacteriota bacterium]